MNSNYHWYSTIDINILDKYGKGTEY